MKVAVGTLLFLFVVQTGFAYTIVMKTGKKIEGTLVSQDETTIVVKDMGGVVLSLRKVNLDVAAMDQINTKSTGQEPSKTSSQPLSRPKSVADIAKRAQE